MIGLPAPHPTSSTTRANRCVPGFARWSRLRLLRSIGCSRETAWHTLFALCAGQAYAAGTEAANGFRPSRSGRLVQGKGTETAGSVGILSLQLPGSQCPLPHASRALGAAVKRYFSSPDPIDRFASIASTAMRPAPVNARASAEAPSAATNSTPPLSTQNPAEA